MNAAMPDLNNGSANGLSYLSHSRVAKYLHCPEQYRLYYVENLRPRVQNASLVFGQVLHQALSILFRAGEDPVAFFTHTWQEVEGVELAYGERESWAKLESQGRIFLTRFLETELPKLRVVQASEKSFRLTVTSLGVPFIGIIDLVASLNGRSTVIDFKTAAASYPSYEVILSDQLTAYQLAEPEAEQSALCVFVKTREPKIEWHISARRPEQVIEYLDKVEYVAKEITAKHFYKRPGRWCSYCDYLPVCLGDEAKKKETLVQVAPRS